MKTLRFVSLCGAAALAVAAAPADTPVVLSPFEVNTRRDTGFVASSSLAGGRLAGELKDTPIAYSVLTREFIDALELTDLTQMTKWSTNAADVPDGDSVGFGIGDRLKLQSRGVGSNSPQRNFFPVNFNFDSYNIERLDLARGPNAVLFGASGVGGTANSVTKRARTERTETEVRLSYGSWANSRATLDHNQPIGKNFAVRLNAVWHDREGWRDNDVERRSGATMSATWKPFKNTEVRLEVEKGRLHHSVITSNFDDNVSGWNGVTYAAVLPANNNPAGVVGYGANNAIITVSGGTGTLMNYQGWARTLGGNSAANVPAGGVVVVGPGANITNNSIIAQQNLPPGLYDIAIARSRFQIPSRSLSTFSDEPIFGLKSEDLTLSLTQRIGERFFAEVAVNKGREDLNSNTGISRGMSRIYVDVNSVLPTGQPNPNFLQPYTESISNPYLQPEDKENARIALGYVLDRTRWGEFKISLMGGTSNVRTDRNVFRYTLKRNADPRQWPSEFQVLYRYYLYSDKTRPLAAPASMTYIDPRTNTTTTIPAGLVRDYGNDAFNLVSDRDYKYAQAATSARLFRDRLNLIAAVRQDRYESRQESNIRQFDNPANWDGYTRFLRPAAPADWGTLSYRERSANGTPVGAPLPANTRPRLSSGARDPLYAGDRFQDDYTSPDQRGKVATSSVGGVFHLTKSVSLFANYAESFRPPGATLRLDGSLFAAPASKGRDFGLRVTLLDGGFVGNLIRYQGEEKNNTITATTFPFNTIIQANALFDFTAGGINSRGLPRLPSGFVDSVDTETKGWEMEVIANFSRHWRLMFNAALPESYQTDPNKDSRAYFTTNETKLRQIINDAGGTFSGSVATFTAVVPPGQPNEGPAAVDAWNTIQNTLASFTSRPQKRTRLFDVTANLYTDYAFQERLKGFKVGAGLNYRGGQVIGYRGADTIRDPRNPGQAIDDPAVS
ncbi:MAG: hypothetical protein EXS37_16745, partial [Opitutus sp.]|nr:hypothetical protein [Opitutus sp.]